VKREYIAKTYGIADWVDHVDFLSQMAVKSGKLLKVTNEPKSKEAKKQMKLIGFFLSFFFFFLLLLFSFFSGWRA
jgi:hypothetical protein